MHHTDNVGEELSILASFQNERQLFVHLMMTGHGSKWLVVLLRIVVAEQFYLDSAQVFEGTLGIGPSLKKLSNLALANLGSRALMYVQGLQWLEEVSVSFLA